MALAILSILAMYNYDDSIMDEMVVPAGVDKELAVNNILGQCAELGLVCTDFDICKQMIGIWSQTNLNAWERMYAALSAEYNPIENYDRKEDWSDKRTDDLKHSDSGTDTSKGSSNNENKVAAFNSDDLVPRDSANAGSEASTTYGHVLADTGTSDNIHSGRMHGNIGVTTNQDMINQELEMRQKSTIYQIIVDSFKQNFCIMVY